MYVLVPVFFFCGLQGRLIAFQTPKRWLAGDATDRHARHACLRFFSFYFSFFLLAFLFILFFLFFFLHAQEKKKPIIKTSRDACSQYVEGAGKRSSRWQTSTRKAGQESEGGISLVVDCARKHSSCKKFGFPQKGLTDSLLVFCASAKP